jgi:hypothetical protein
MEYPPILAALELTMRMLCRELEGYRSMGGVSEYSGNCGVASGGGSESSPSILILDPRVRAMRKQDPNDIETTFRPRFHQRGPTIVVLRVDIGASAEQLPDSGELPAEDSFHQRRAAVLINSVNAGAAIQKGANGVCASDQSRSHQAGKSFFAACVQTRSLERGPDCFCVRCSYDVSHWHPRPFAVEPQSTTQESLVRRIGAKRLVLGLLSPK